MRLSEFSVKNSLLVNLVSVFILLAGTLAMMNLRRDAFPQVDFDIVTVGTAYPGASAEDVEKFVTIPIEKELKGISGVKEMESTSEEGFSSIGITIDPETSDKDQVVDDIRTAVERVNNLPEGIEEDPLVVEIKSKERPILEISLSGNFSEGVKRQYAEALEDRLLDVKGVASIRRIGWRDREIWVEVYPEKLKEYHVSINEVMDSLRRQNITLPGGLLTTKDTEYSLRISGEFSKAEQVDDVIIRSNDSGVALRIKDVARVVDSFADETRIAKVNKKSAVAMVVIKSEQGDVISVVKDVGTVIDQFKEELPEGMEVTLANDFSYYVKRRLGVLKNNGIIGFFFVLVILFLFFDPLPSFLTALGIPIVLFITFLM
ncbi:MAG: efflux RND transporter permease subunit, partial [Candidatus Omnitrophica bacterium]|nr:efflux RND transporter permease subunit [Candidatus Omnitrophota bacterium]